MRILTYLLASWIGLAAVPLAAQEPERFVERTPPPRIPPQNTQERAGYSSRIAPWATSGVTRFESGGYIGGGSLRNNNALLRGAVTTGAPQVGTFGWDFAGFRDRPGRVFLAATPNTSGQKAIARNYRSDGPLHLPDPLSLRPLRKAILGLHEEKEERKKEEHKKEEH